MNEKPGDGMVFGDLKEALDVIENDITKRGPLPSVWSYNVDNLGRDLGIHFTKKSKYKGWFEELGDNTLIIVIDDKEYNLGKAKTVQTNSEKAYYAYENSESEKVVELLKQEGKTYRFHCKWYD